MILWAPRSEVDGLRRIYVICIRMYSDLFHSSLTTHYIYCVVLDRRIHNRYTTLAQALLSPPHAVGAAYSIRGVVQSYEVCIASSVFLGYWYEDVPAALLPSSAVPRD